MYDDRRNADFLKVYVLAGSWQSKGAAPFSDAA
jgi:hypothetical protein